MSTDESLHLKILEINSESQYLETIMQLANANSATLGFFPYGAFRRLADKGFVLACVIPQIGCVGYLLYETSRYKVKLRHLCVAEQWRGKGITKALVKYLKDKTHHLQGIQASCRRDYNLRGMWAALGFVAIHERPGRRREGSILTEWWLNYGHPNLLTTLTQQVTESKICAAIDANIFYDIADEETADEDSKESKALFADWLEPELELCLTDEINNEIDRNKDDKKRAHLRKVANQFTILSCKQEVFDKACQALRRFFPSNLTDSDASDLRQLARVIGSDIKASFFVTRDTRLLEEIEEEIYREFGLTIIHPIDLILRLDELRRETEYQPIRLAGTSIERKRVQSGEQDLLIDQFLKYALGESKVAFRRTLRQVLSDLDHYECFTVGRRGEVPIALIAYERTNTDELIVPIFRFRDTQFTPTILRHCIFDCFSKAANEGKKFTRITETKLETEITLALQEDYFLETPGEWLRANLKVVDSIENILSHLSNICETEGENYNCLLPLIESLSDENLANTSKLAANFEKILYPIKITDVEVPSFIIPIQSWWAKDLFDKELAEEILWGAKEELALKREVVYYRSKQASGGLQAPGRILWYVSKSGGEDSYSTLGAIRACSQLDEIIIGKPIDLHKRFRRLGIYNFKDVLNTAKRDFNREIMAVKFSNTELFEKPIKLKEIQQLLGHTISVRAPYKLTSNEFILLYNSGIFTKPER